MKTLTTECVSDSPGDLRFVATCVCLREKSKCRTNKCACRDEDCQCHNKTLRIKKHRFSATNLRYLFQATIVGVLSVTTMSAPVPARNTAAHHTSSLTSSNKQTTFHRGSDQPKWVNPCGLPGHVFDEADMRNAPDSAVSLTRIFENIYKSAAHATQQTNEIKRDFVTIEFRDASFEEVVQYDRQEWLPVTPDPTVSHLSTLTHEEALRSTFEFLQYYAVGVEEILLDATLHDSSFRDEFQKIETYLTQLLCDVQMGMYVLHVKRNDDVLRDVMSQEYRDLPDRASRLVRDYLILRDYAKTVKYIAELFDYLKKKL